MRECGAAGTISVMVVIGPAEAGAVLPLVLDGAGPVSLLPVIALGGEEQVAGPVGPDVIGGGGEKFGGVAETFDDRRETALTAQKFIAMVGGRGNFLRRRRNHTESGVAVAFDEPEF